KSSSSTAHDQFTAGAQHRSHEHLVCARCRLGGRRLAQIWPLRSPSRMPGSAVLVQRPQWGCVWGDGGDDDRWSGAGGGLWTVRGAVDHPVAVGRGHPDRGCLLLHRACVGTGRRAGPGNPRDGSEPHCCPVGRGVCCRPSADAGPHPQADGHFGRGAPQPGDAPRRLGAPPRRESERTHRPGSGLCPRPHGGGRAVPRHRLRSEAGNVPSGGRGGAVTAVADAAALRPLSLAEVNALASLTLRSCRKYVVPARLLPVLVDHLAHDFGVLCEEGRTAFRYSSTYFDTPDLVTFRQHRQQRRRRFKIRTRSYLDSGLTMLEVKLKGARGVTDKRRTPHDGRPDELTPAAARFLGEVLYDYGAAVPRPLTAVAVTDYQRTTLVALSGTER